MRLAMVAKSEVAEVKKSEELHSQLQASNEDMVETLATVQNLKIDLRDSEKAGSEAQAMFGESQQQLDMVKAIAERLSFKHLKLLDSLSLKSSELEESKAQVKSLEEVVKKLQASKLFQNVDSDQLPKKSQYISVIRGRELRCALRKAEIK
ncbi:interactor of constitutive active ROPs 3-like [Typha latifolia]|uniref:interactor of constitutive active ROPs 3-like n=1 Tax=Typha latifolia TaxID=4733 RepID=UPI003C308192